jgi:hypothetical protein
MRSFTETYGSVVFGSTAGPYLLWRQGTDYRLAQVD